MSMDHRLVRYIVIGLTAYSVEMTSLYICRHLFDLKPVVAVAISFWVGFVVAFVLQKLVTFKNHEKTPHILGGQLLRYSLLTLWNYGFTLIAVKLLQHNVSVFIIRTAVIGVITTWN